MLLPSDVAAYAAAVPDVVSLHRHVDETELWLAQGSASATAASGAVCAILERLTAACGGGARVSLAGGGVSFRAPKNAAAAAGQPPAAVMDTPPAKGSPSALTSSTRISAPAAAAVPAGAERYLPGPLGAVESTTGPGDSPALSSLDSRAAPAGAAAAAAAPNTTVQGFLRHLGAAEHVLLLLRGVLASDVVEAALGGHGGPEGATGAAACLAVVRAALRFLIAFAAGNPVCQGELDGAVDTIVGLLPLDVGAEELLVTMFHGNLSLIDATSEASVRGCVEMAAAAGGSGGRDARFLTPLHELVSCNRLPVKRAALLVLKVTRRAT
jgi:hypothetical protein